VEGAGVLRACCEGVVDYQTLEHTADIGIRVRGGDFAEILAKAALALADLLYDPTQVEKRARRKLRLEEAERESLLVRWLNDLIVLREVEDFVWCRVDLTWRPGGALEDVLQGERFDENRHLPRTGLKAATYHLLEVRPARKGLSARVIFDV
jgi:SHS2 domain-containing protein